MMRGSVKADGVEKNVLTSETVVVYPLVSSTSKIKD